MSTLVFPPSLTPAKIDWHLDRGGVLNRGLLSAATQRVDFGFQSWRASVGMPTLVDEDAAIFQAFMDEACRFDRHFYFSFPQTLRGSFDASELLTNGTFDGSSTWTATNATATAGSRLIRVQNSGAASGYIYAAVSLTAGQNICVVADAVPGITSAFKVELYDTVGAAIVASATGTAPARVVFTATATNTGVHRIRLRVDTVVTNDYLYYTFASAFKCILVNGSSNTGNNMSVDGASMSVNGLLKRSDMFTVMVNSVPSLHRLTRDVDSNSLGSARLFFEPALPGSPADNAPIILNRPFCRMMIPKHSTSAMFTPPMLMGSAFECIEDPTR